MPQGELAQVLRGVLKPADKRLIVGPSSVDDAGVVVLGESEGMPAGSSIALVQTVDYFPPVVDDPYLYGAIAAANSLSDVYAMGGRAFSALNLAGFPKDFPKEWITEIFRGGFDKIAEAGAIIAGGHTVQSPEAQFGFAVTGLVDQARLTTNAGAKAGDLLYLTKPLGMGTMTTSAKFGKITWEVMKGAAEQMATLNDRAAAAMNEVETHACTDVTGFGLAGHAHNIGKASEVTLRIDLEKVPLYPGALKLAQAGNLSGGAKRGRASLREFIGVDGGIDEALVNLAFDAETSGGLLILVPAASASRLEAELAARDQLVACIGEVREATGSTVEFA
ncbi:MAG: selenide,water dikinase [Planctomycetota bacterium]|jgi:selenide,water dikinase